MNVLQRQLGGRRVRLERADRILWVCLLRLCSDWRRALVIVRTETVLRWHRRGFRLYSRWKSHPRRPGMGFSGGTPLEPSDERRMFRVLSGG